MSIGSCSDIPGLCFVPSRIIVCPSRTASSKPFQPSSHIAQVNCSFPQGTSAFVFGIIYLLTSLSVETRHHFSRNISSSRPEHLLRRNFFDARLTSIDNHRIALYACDFDHRMVDRAGRERALQVGARGTGVFSSAANNQTSFQVQSSPSNSTAQDRRSIFSHSQTRHVFHQQQQRQRQRQQQHEQSKCQL